MRTLNVKFVVAEDFADLVVGGSGGGGDGGGLFHLRAHCYEA